LTSGVTQTQITGTVNDYGHNGVNKDRSQVIASCITDNIKGLMLSVIVTQFSGNLRGNSSTAVAATQSKSTKTQNVFKRFANDSNVSKTMTE